MADLDDCPETGDFFLARIQIDDEYELHIWGDRNAEPVAELPQDEFLELKRQGLQAFTAWLDQHGVAYEVVPRVDVVYAAGPDRP